MKELRKTEKIGEKILIIQERCGILIMRTQNQLAFATRVDFAIVIIKL
jgi:hypothetical protein